MKKPLVSIIIPTFNRHKELLRAVKSALNQTYKNLEIIIIDDYPKNPAEEIILKIKDKRIIYIKNKENIGGCASRNIGLKLAKGEFINFLDDDDEFTSNKIEEQLKVFEKSKDKKLAVVLCDAKNNIPEQKNEYHNHLKGNLHKQLLKKYAIYGTLTMLIKKTALQNVKFDPKFQSNQEYDFMIQLAKENTFDFIPKILCMVYESPNQISFNFNKKLKGTKTFWKKYKKEIKQEGVSFYYYNKARITYLLIKYKIGKYFGRKIYSMMP